LKNFAVSTGCSALLRRFLPAVALLGIFAPAAPAQVSFSGHAGSASTVQAAPREPANPEPDDKTLPRVRLWKEAPIFPQWNVTPDAGEADEGLGLAVKPPPSPAATEEADKPSGTGATPPQPATLRLGNVTFNEMAQSVNAWKVGPARADDLSRQFQMGVATPNVIDAIPVSGWAAIGLGAFAIILGMVLGQYENDHEERQRQKRRRHHRRHHRDHRSGEGDARSSS
jgi:hypothetical protein